MCVCIEIITIAMITMYKHISKYLYIVFYDMYTYTDIIHTYI